MKIYEAKVIYSCVGEVQAPYEAAKPETILDYMKDSFEQNPVQEQVWLVVMNRKTLPITRHLISIGTMDSCLVDRAAIFRSVILNHGTGFVLLHNHPSGDPAPSIPDTTITRDLREASKIMGINFLDHIIVGDRNSDPLQKGYYSFREAGLV